MARFTNTPAARARASLLAMVLALAACSGGGSAPEESRAAEAPADTTSATMDHSPHAAADSTAAPEPGTPSSGMDHSTMAGGDHSAPAGAATRRADATAAAQDHSAAGHQMSPAAGVSRGSASAAAMNHASMPGMQRASTTAAGPPADPHAGHTPAAAPGAAGRDSRPALRSSPPGGAGAATLAADSATARLLTLARELVDDPVVQQRIEQTPALREAWSDPAVRRILTEPQP
ncbi:MAG: hypothetical protein KY464_14785 [Gemmatimonadetes bacterium]|nr:hypothetical protein [Gemmatimonadota bacterium]